MTTSTRDDSHDRERPRGGNRHRANHARFAPATSGPRSQAQAVSAASPAKTKATVRCRLCGEAVALESDFRATPAQCPHCGLKFVFDPQAEPLPVRGLRLRWSEVIEAQRRGDAGYHRRHEAHRPAPAPLPQTKTNFLSWVGGWVFAVAGFIALFSLLRHR